MKTSSKMAFALTGLAVLCVCAVMAAPMGAGDGAGHGGMMGGGDAPAMDGDRPAMDGDAPAMNEERMQEMIEKLQADGVDTIALETALEDGDQEAVRAFMDANRPADAPEQNGERGNHGMDEERMQEMIEKLQADGVDTTALETALEDGDQEAVRAFMDANRPADAPEHGNGPHRGGLSEE